MRLKKKVVSSLVSIVTALSLSYGVANADLILKKDGSKVYNYYYNSENLESITVSNGKEKIDVKKSDIKDYIYTKQDINEETALLLEELKAMEDWGEAKLGVPKSDNYLEYDESFTTYHMLYYCKKLELPNTYFDLDAEYFKSEDEALNRKAELESQGYDVYYRTAEAVANGSVISKEMIESELDRKLFVIFHENSHDLTDLLIDVDEACANIAGFFGGLEYIEEKYGKSSGEYKKYSMLIEKVDKDDELIIKYYNKLEQLFNSNLSKEEKLEQKEQLLEGLRTEQSMLWGTLIEKNSIPGIVSDITYSRFGPLAKKVYEKAGSTKEAVKVFKELSDKIKWVKHMYNQDYTRDYCKKYLEDYLNS
jgi:hypothetical protein